MPPPVADPDGAVTPTVTAPCRAPTRNTQRQRFNMRNGRFGQARLRVSERNLSIIIIRYRQRMSGVSAGDIGAGRLI